MCPPQTPPYVTPLHPLQYRGVPAPDKRRYLLQVLSQAGPQAKKTEKERLGLSFESTLPTLMAEPQINDPAASDPAPHPATESSTPDCRVCESWQQMLQGVLGI